MKRNFKHGICSNGTIRYVGNRKYSTRGIFEYETRRGDVFKFRTEYVQYCVHCGGSKFSCKAFPHEVNQYGKKMWNEGKEKILHLDLL